MMEFYIQNKNCGPRDNIKPNKMTEIMTLFIFLPLLNRHPPKAKNGKVKPIQACLLRSAQKGSESLQYGNLSSLNY